MRVNKIVLSLIVLFLSFTGFADTVDLETFETISATIKTKQNLILQDESPLKIILQYSQPQRKIQTNNELSESSLSAE